MKVKNFSFTKNYNNTLYLKNFKKFFNQLKRMKYMCVNIDFDGMLTALLIKRVFPHIEIVGFNDSKNHIWIKKGYEHAINDMIWVDYYTNRGGVSIDQHIVSNREKKFDKSFYNPNVMFGVSNQNYGSKYPFGIYHILRADFEKLGYDFNDIDIYSDIMGVCKFFEIEMRTDSTLGSFVDEKYRKKSDGYRNIMCDGLKENSITKKFFSEMGKMVLNGVNDSNTWKKWKGSFTNRVRNTFDLTVGTGYKSMSTGFFKLFNELHKVFKIKFSIDTNVNNYTDIKLIRVRYATSDLSQLDKICCDNRIVAGVFPYKNTYSVQINATDVKSFIYDYWEHISGKNHTNERCIEEDGHTIFVRKSNENGTGYFEKKVGLSKKSEWVKF